MQVDIPQVVALVECPPADRPHRVENNHLGEAFIAVEGGRTDNAGSVRQRIRAVFLGHRIADQAAVIPAEQHSVVQVQVRIPFGNRQVRQPGAAFKGIHADLRQGGGQDHLFQVGAAAESVIPEANQTVLDFQFLQVIICLESGRPDSRNFNAVQLLRNNQGGFRSFIQDDFCSAVMLDDIGVIPGLLALLRNSGRKDTAKEENT